MRPALPLVEAPGYVNDGLGGLLSGTAEQRLLRLQNLRVCYRYKISPQECVRLHMGCVTVAFFKHR